MTPIATFTMVFLEFFGTSVDHISFALSLTVDAPPYFMSLMVCNLW